MNKGTLGKERVETRDQGTRKVHCTFTLPVLTDGTAYATALTAWVI